MHKRIIAEHEFMSRDKPQISSTIKWDASRQAEGFASVPIYWNVSPRGKKCSQKVHGATNSPLAISCCMYIQQPATKVQSFAHWDAAPMKRCRPGAPVILYAEFAAVPQWQVWHRPQLTPSALWHALQSLEKNGRGMQTEMPGIFLCKQGIDSHRTKAERYEMHALSV